MHLSKFEGNIDIQAAKKVRVGSLNFQKYISTRLVDARQLTSLDYHRTFGRIYTFDGSDGFFKPGDYLLRGVQDDVWIVKETDFVTHFIPAAPADEMGWGVYRYASQIEAAQLPEVWSEEQMWVVGDAGYGVYFEGKPGHYISHSLKEGPHNGEITWEQNWQVDDPDRFEQLFRLVGEETLAEETGAPDK